MLLTTTEEVSWAAFPGAVQLPILEHTKHDEPATVSRQWQDAIERHNFERITLTLWRMPEFEPMTRRNRAFIKCIRLNLEQEGDMSEGLSENRLVPSTTDKCTIVKAIHDLFWILSTWKPEEKLRLESNVCSSSTSQQLGWNVNKRTSAPGNQDLEHVPQEILGKESRMFFNDEYENAWWQSLPEAPAVRSLHLPLKDHPRWRQTTLEYMISRLPNLEEFHFEPNDESISSQQIPTTHAARHDILTERLGLAGSRPCAMHDNPSYSGTTWAKALAYYRRTEQLYCDRPDFEYYFRNEFDPSRRPDH